MAVDNRVQFAFVREDPNVEIAAIDRTSASSALLIASGGCSALTLRASRPSVALTLLDMNRAQLDLVEKKHAFLRSTTPTSPERRAAFGCAGVDDPTSLVGCGNFESLFRGLRAVLDDLVMPASDRARLLRDDVDRTRLIANKYWPVAFAMFFSDPMLEAMFGKDATQHATPGSYPSYFRTVIERGLQRADASTNAWLHQFLLGHQLQEPPYLAHDFSSSPPLELVHATMQEAPDFARFDVVSLSNLFDWMSADVVASIARRLRAECKSGAVVVVRQLNNRAPIEASFAPEFVVEQTLSDDLLSHDRSLFYERLVVLVKR